MFLLDDKRISEINMISGRTRKRTPKLNPLLNSVVKMTSSSSGKSPPLCSTYHQSLYTCAESAVSLGPLRLVALWTPGVRRAVPVEQRQGRAKDGESSARSSSNDCGHSRCAWTLQTVS